MVGKQLEGDGRRDGGDQGVAGRDGDVVVHGLRRLLIPLGDDAQNPCPPGAAFLDVADRLVLAGNIAGEGDHGRTGDEKGDGAVFQFGRMIALGMDVGDLLELERAFQRHRIHGAATDEEGMLLRGVLRGEFGNHRVLGDHPFHQRRDSGDLAGKPDSLVA